METIDVLDLKRMLFGDESPFFLVEIVVRTVIVYVYALLLLRWLGSRTIGQLSTVEFLLVIALGSAVGDAMFYPDVPLVHALLVVTVVVLANKGLDILIARFKQAERAIDGVPEEVMRDGVICKPFLSSTTMGVSELFQELRERGIEQLGQVASAYVEADGGLTVFRTKEAPRPGLPIVPPWEIEKPQEVSAGIRACLRCGAIADHAGLCSHCGNDRFTGVREGTRYATSD
ncbi:MAG: DUF421 domain-containing protein [Hyphomicrobiales bacterium]|nr:MAG: DUF421 domain-containing protein [Hyphomicrobiales bacterium]